MSTLTNSEDPDAMQQNVALFVKVKIIYIKIWKMWPVNL